MQLKIATFFMFLPWLIFAQNQNSKEDATVNFLMTYYEQDGLHSAVTGGAGTEELNNIAPAVIVYVPLDSSKSLSFNGGVDFYTSASSDNINNPFLDPNHVSGASRQDARVYLTAGYKRKNKAKETEKTIYLGFSSEFDVLSFSAGAAYGKASKDRNKSIDLKLMYFYDHWKLIYPVEFRNGTVQYLNTNQRHSIIGTITGSFNVNKKLAASISTDLVLQGGLLSTPFHRVYFSDVSLPGIEQLPNTRFKIPIGIRLNYHLTDFLIFRGFYRYYYDTWEVTGQTAEITLPIKLSQAFRIYPFYRYHHQDGALYFLPFGEHSSQSTFFTSDFDLSTIWSQKIGLGISIQPLFGLARFGGKKRATLFKSLDFRYASYQRSDGLTADVVTMEAVFNIQKRP